MAYRIRNPRGFLTFIAALLLAAVTSLAAPTSTATFTTTTTPTLRINKVKIIVPKPATAHDRAKSHLIPADAPWLHALGVTNDRGQPREGMADKFRFALNCKGPVLIHCQVDPEEDLLPMLLGGHTLDDMFNESSF